MTQKQVFLNNLSVRLTTSISTTDTTLTLQSPIPLLSTDEYYVLTLDVRTNVQPPEVIKVVDVSVDGLTLTVERGQEDTVPLSWDSTTTVLEMRLTSGSLNTLRGDLNQSIDVIEGLLASDDTTLDELQEVVDFIKANRADLDALGISSIAGLELALNAKVDKVFGKQLSDENYSLAEKNKLSGIQAGAQANPGDASTSNKGVTQYATGAETASGSVQAKAITPAGLHAYLGSAAANGTGYFDPAGAGASAATSAVAAHKSETSAHAAANVTYDNSTSGATPVDVQGAIDGAYSHIESLAANVLPADVVWDSVSDEHSRLSMNTVGVTSVHRNMRRCVLNDDATVNYYLNANDSTLKADGTAADLSGADGQVMVEIQRTYVRYSMVDGEKRWQVSPNPAHGFVLHPAFKIGGTPAFNPTLGFWDVTGHTQEVSHRYYAAYSASVYSASGGAYIDGLNLDNNDARVNTTTDVLASVSGKYPMVGLTRSQFRALASNRGGSWNQLDYWLQQLVLILFITEYAGFDSQTLVGEGNARRAYIASSEVQADSPHTVAGVSNNLGNRTGAGGEPTPFVSYRGIENFWGQCWHWMDGININDNTPYISGDPAQFADNTTTGYTSLPAMPGTDGYIRDVHGETLTFLPSDTSGSSSVAFSDHYWQNPGWGVAGVGGHASHALDAGAFALIASHSSASRSRFRGGRLAAFGAKTNV